MYFNAKKVTNDLVEAIRRWFDENGRNCVAVVGISGGKDSTVAAALCVKALGKDRVIGVLMPQGVQPDIEDSYAVVKHLGIRHYEINIDDAVSSVLREMENGILVSNQTRINLPPRIRMATLYAVSQSVNGRVVNTCNASENWIGYFTRWGDGVGDFSPLGDLTSDEVVAIGIKCGLPEHLVYKTPSDGLCGQTDEDNFGFTYAALNEYLHTGHCENESVREKIDRLHEKNEFKMNNIPTYSPICCDWI